MLGQASPVEAKVVEVIAPSLEAMGYALVRVRLLEKEKRRTLQIMAERIDREGMKVEDCEAISHQVSALLDVHDPINGAYHLEVSSPGIDRPLVRKEDFEQYAGFEAKLETSYPLDGRKRFRGELAGIDGEAAVIRVDGQAYNLPLESIAQAKLVLTDALIKAYQDGSVGH